MSTLNIIECGMVDSICKKLSMLFNMLKVFIQHVDILLTWNNLTTLQNYGALCNTLEYIKGFLGGRAILSCYIFDEQFVGNLILNVGNFGVGHFCHWKNRGKIWPTLLNLLLVGRFLKIFPFYL